jgi:hypothetical protein
MGGRGKEFKGIEERSEEPESRSQEGGGMRLARDSGGEPLYLMAVLLVGSCGSRKPSAVRFVLSAVDEIVELPKIS